MSTKSRIVLAFACLTLLAAAPAGAHDGYGRPRGYAPYPPPAYVYQPPVIYRPPPVLYYRPAPVYDWEPRWRRHHHPYGRSW